MEAKEFLKEVKAMDARIETTKEEIEMLEAWAEKRTQSIDGAIVMTSGGGSRIENGAIKINEKKKELQIQLDAYMDYRIQAHKIISEACNAECNILLHRKYLGVYDKHTKTYTYHTWKQIADELHYTEQWVIQGLHPKALSQVQIVLDRLEKKR